MSIDIIVVVALVIVIGAAINATRATRAKRLREAEERRTVDKGKHVELYGLACRLADSVIAYWLLYLRHAQTCPRHESSKRTPGR